MNTTVSETLWRRLFRFAFVGAMAMAVACGSGEEQASDSLDELMEEDVAEPATKMSDDV